VYNNSSMTSQTDLGAASVNSSTKTSGGNVQLRGDFEKCGIFTTSFMAEDDEYDAFGFAISNNDKGHPAFDLDKAFQIYSGLFQYEVSPLEHMGLVAGLGLFDQVRESGSDQNYSYLLGAHYDLFEGTRFKIDTSRRVRFPTLKDLYDPVTGNPNLVPEYSRNYEAGVEQKLPCKTVCSFVGFITNAHDFIVGGGNGNPGAFPGSGLGSTTENYAMFHFRGFEVNVENRYVENLLLRASYSFLHSANMSPDFATEVLQYRPEDKFTFDGSYRFLCGTSLNVSLLFVANQYAIGRSYPPPLLPIPAYTVVDVKLNQSLMHNHLDLYVGVRNLLDENYYETYGYPQPGRMIYGGMTYKFGPGGTDRGSH
jgi:vitamin B12 transporter